MDDLVLDRKRRRCDRRVGRVRERGLPLDFATVLVGGDDARRAVGRSDHEVAPERGAAVALLLGLFRVMRQTIAAHCARGAVDLVEHAPGVGDVEEAILGERGGLDPLVAGAAAERHRVGELEAFDVRLVDALER